MFDLSARIHMHVERFYIRDKTNSKIDVKVTYVLLEVNRRTLKQRSHEFVRVPGHGIGSVNESFFFVKNVGAYIVINPLRTELFYLTQIKIGYGR